MKEHLLLLLFFYFIFFTVANTGQAQIKKPGFTLGVSGIYANPQSTFANNYNFGIGAEMFGGVGWGNTFIIGTAGFTAFKAKTSSMGTLTYVPVKLGLKQFLIKKLLFVNGDLGLASVKNKTNNSSNFTRGVGAGIKLPGVEAGLYYNGWKNKNIKGFSNSVEVKFGWSILL